MLLVSTCCLLVNNWLFGYLFLFGCGWSSSRFGFKVWALTLDCIPAGGCRLWISIAQSSTGWHQRGPAGVGTSFECLSSWTWRFWLWNNRRGARAEFFVPWARENYRSSNTSVKFPIESNGLTRHSFLFFLPALGSSDSARYMFKFTC